VNKGSWAILVAALLAGCHSREGTQRRIEHAEQLLAAGEYSQALIEVRNALKHAHDDPRALLLLARANLELGDLRAAEDALASAESAAGAAAAAPVRARIELQSGRYQELLASLEAGKLPLDASQAALARAQALAGLHRCNEAVPVARRLRVDGTQVVAATVVLAECYAGYRNPAGARALLEQAVQAQPQRAEGWLALGRLQELSGQRADAQASWEQALLHAPGQLSLIQQLNLLSELATLQLARGDLAGARGTHARMVRIAPDGALTELLGARVTLIDGKSGDAVTKLRGMANRYPQVDTVQLALASALLMAGDREQSLQLTTELAGQRDDDGALRRAAALIKGVTGKKTDTEEYWIQSAAAQVMLKQPAVARIALEHASQAAPQSIRPVLALARIDLATGNAAPALHALEPLAEKNQGDETVSLLLADALVQSGQMSRANQVLTAQWQRAPSAALAASLHRVRTAGKFPEPLLPWSQWVASHPRELRERLGYAEALRAAGENRAAIAEYEKLLALAPQDVTLLNNLAWLYGLEKDPRALATARRAYELAPQLPSVADTYGRLALAAGELPKAREALEAAYRAGGLVDPEIRFHYAAALAQGTEQAAARSQLTELLAEPVEFDSRHEAEALLASLK
jgi:tetratricopeptide (TPR) repeat protein